MFKLKSLSEEGIPEAFKKVERYRLLNEPIEAESICLDILNIDPDNQEALVLLLLSITDQFDTGSAEDIRRAREVLPRLAGAYKQQYYLGIIHERHAKAILNLAAPGCKFDAYDEFRNAMDAYDQAEGKRPAGNDDAIVRWNTCVRIINRKNLEPRQEEYCEHFLE